MMTKPTKQNAHSAQDTPSARTASGRRRRGKRLNPFATRLSAHVTEEEAWITNPPNVTLSRMFLVVLLLHIVIVGGILAFEMFKDDPVGPAASAAAGPSPWMAIRSVVVPESAGGRPKGSKDRASYRVQAGDTLSQIAKLHNVTSGEIRALNRIGSGDQIFPGQVLLVPENRSSAENRVVPASGLPGVADGDAAEILPAGLRGNVVPDGGGEMPDGNGEPAMRTITPPNPNVVSVPPQALGRTHKVESGETAFAISRKYGVTVEGLLKANGIADARNLRAGNIIQIP